MKPFVPSQGRRARQGLAGVFALPLVLFAASLAGLILGLTGEGTPDVLAWALLSLPVFAVCIAWRRRGRSPSPKKDPT